MGSSFLRPEPKPMQQSRYTERGNKTFKNPLHWSRSLGTKTQEMPTIHTHKTTQKQLKKRSNTEKNTPIERVREKQRHRHRKREQNKKRKEEESQAQKGQEKLQESERRIWISWFPHPTNPGLFCVHCLFHHHLSPAVPTWHDTRPQAQQGERRRRRRRRRRCCCCSSHGFPRLMSSAAAAAAAQALSEKELEKMMKKKKNRWVFTATSAALLQLLIRSKTKQAERASERASERERETRATQCDAERRI